MIVASASVGVQRKHVIGCSKSGLRVSLHEHARQIVLRGRADPLLLYLAIGGALGLGLLASILRSPAQGLVSSFVFSILFSPILLFLIYSTLRLRTHCVISKPEGAVFILERSYGRQQAVTIPLADLTGIVVTTRSQLPIVGSPDSYSVYLETDKLRYLVLVGYDEGAVQRIAERLAGALELPVTLLGFDDPASGVQVPGRLLTTTAALYLAPPLVAIAAIYFGFHEVSQPDRLMITSLGAIVVSQLGAILAFAYFRTHEPRDG
ncbi:MAG: hypothetical protein HY690_07825 [Chloroflexi bacterium]|nr:hypothetical protein [Chloroflexota bacterium]